MKLNRYWVSIALPILFLCLFVWSGQGQSSSNAVWQYKVVVLQEYEAGKIESALAEYGKQGWELIDIKSNNPSSSSSGYYYFKRAK
jgi:hypothetical protein